VHQAKLQLWNSMDLIYILKHNTAYLGDINSCISWGHKSDTTDTPAQKILQQRLQKINLAHRIILGSH